MDDPWSSWGDHLIIAKVMNPDGTEVEVQFTYSVLGPDPLGIEGKGPPGPLLVNANEGTASDSPVLRPFEEDWPGYLIIAVCSLVAGLKLVSMVLVLAKKDPLQPQGSSKKGPNDFRGRRDVEGFERWD
jgi:hypothetical protein